MPLRAPPLPVAARQTMRNAFEDLQMAITPQDSKNFGASTLQQVRREALDIENQVASRGWLRNMRRLKPLLTALEHYSRVVDTLCNGTPFLPWIWAPITLILRISSEHIESFDVIIGAYSRIASALSRFEILDEAVGRDPRLSETLASYYAELLEFHKHAYKFVRRSGWKLMFATSWGRFQRRFDNILENMKRHEDLIDRTANACNIAEATRMRQDLRSWRDESLDRIRREDQEQAEKEFQAIRAWLRVHRSEQLTMLEALSDQGNKHPGTCDWVYKHDKIRSWLQNSTQTSLLWLSGTAGTGKSVIATQLVKSARNLPDVIVLYHIFSSTSLASSEYEHAVKSLLEQLLQQDADLTAHIYGDFVLKKQSPTVSVLEKLLPSLLTSSSGTVDSPTQVRIVLDGVDELPDHSPNTQVKFLRLLKRLLSGCSASGNVTCKILISGRPSTTLSQMLRSKPTISLTVEKAHLDQSIQEYALQRLGSLRNRLQQLGMTDEEVIDIGKQISRKSDGMFLYARLVLDYISSNIFVRSDELKDAIHQLPERLADFYRKLLAQILAPLDENSKEHIRCIVGWVAFARRPLQRSELLSAISFSSGDPEVSFPAPEYILDVCRSLIEERGDTTLAFIHVSVKEFLQSPSSSLKLTQTASQQQHSIATVTCLLSSFNLLKDDLETPYRLLLRGVYGIQVYAAEFWTDDVLDMVQKGLSLQNHAHLRGLLDRLVAGLDTAPDAQNQKSKLLQLPTDPRLDYLKGYENIRDLVHRDISSRSLKQLEQHLEFENAPQVDTLKNAQLIPSGVSALLARYQTLLLRLMNEPDVVGISVQELDAFRGKFRLSMHTCRLRSCPRATVGFESSDLRMEHELSHVRRSLYSCTDATCQYPPFFTAQALRAHAKQRHGVPSPRKSIRRMRANIGSQPVYASYRGAAPTTDAPASNIVTTAQPPQFELNLGDVPAPPPAVGPAKFPAPPVPEWLEAALVAFRTLYVHDVFEGVMRYCAVDSETEQLIQQPISSQKIKNTKWVFRPRIRCADCQEKLYMPGPGASAEDFAVHLRNKEHRNRVDTRVGTAGNGITVLRID